MSNVNEHTYHSVYFYELYKEINQPYLFTSYLKILNVTVMLTSSNE